MGKFEAFLNPTFSERTEDIIVSARFKDADGNPALFRIRSITQDENDALIKKSTRRVKENGQSVEQLDRRQYTKRIVVACTVSPDFADAELCKSYGVLDPLDLPGRMLLVGEFLRLSEQIMAINGYDDADELETEAKN
jgi:hypothetical protein